MLELAPVTTVCHCQGIQWNRFAVYTDQHGERVRVPTGSQCLPCLKVMVSAYATVGWQGLLEIVRVQPDKRKEFLHARALLQSVQAGEVHKAFEEAEIEKLCLSGRRVEQVDYLLPVEWFDDKQKALEEITLFNHLGQQVSGVLTRVPSNDDSLKDDIKRNLKDFKDGNGGNGMNFHKVITYHEELYVHKDRPIASYLTSDKHTHVKLLLSRV